MLPQFGDAISFAGIGQAGRKTLLQICQLMFALEVESRLGPDCRIEEAGIFGDQVGNAAAQGRLPALARQRAVQRVQGRADCQQQDSPAR